MWSRNELSSLAEASLYNCQRVTMLNCRLSEHLDLNQGTASLYFNWPTIYRVSHRFYERKKIRDMVCQYKTADIWNARSALGHVPWDTQQVHTVSVKCILRNKECSFPVLLRSIRHGKKKVSESFTKKHPTLTALHTRTTCRTVHKLRATCSVLDKNKNSFSRGEIKGRWRSSGNKLLKIEVGCQHPQQTAQ